MIRDTPTITEAIDAVANKGVSKIVLVPAFLAPGVHTTEDIPGLIGVKEKEPQLKAKGIELVYGEPIGSDERIADILEEKALKPWALEVKKDTEILDAYSVAEAGKIVDKVHDAYPRSHRRRSRKVTQRQSPNRRTGCPHNS